MKYRRISPWLKASTVISVSVLLIASCSVTPHANVGLDVDFRNGDLKVRPTAHVGLSGRPAKNRN